MTSAPSATPSHHRAVRLWLLAVAALMFVTVVVGGATRLTESGLSIVEWKPVTGVLPPLDEQAWQVEFDKYKAIPQYRERNAGMSLHEFKVIYWWEWTHRVLARLIGAAFLLPLLWFLWRGELEGALRVRLWTIFGLGAALGAVGWWMVASGLADRVSVSQYRLAFHLTLACAIFAAILWTAQGLAPRVPLAAPARLRAGAIALLVLVLVQTYLGALVSGLRAGLIYNTWPLIDGSLVPESARLLFEVPLWRNFFENTLTVQFDHRMVAYALWLVAVLHAADVARTVRGGAALTGALALAGAVTLQAALGIATLVHQAPLALALLHQAMAIVVLAIAVVHAERLERRPARVAAATGRRGHAPWGADDVIEVAERDGVALLRMADGKVNAMSLELCEALTARFKDLSAAPAIVVAGTGRIFSAGVDLIRLLDGGVPYIREFLPALSAMFAAVFSHPRPVVSAINGHAIAGGCVLACAGDKRLMAREAGHIGATELLVGVAFPSIAMEIMRSAMAPQYLEDAIFSGAAYAPQEALVRGLVHEIVDPPALIERAVGAAKTLAAISPSAFAFTKRQIRASALQPPNRAEIDAAVMQIWTAPETLDRIRDYVSRTLRKS